MTWEYKRLQLPHLENSSTQIEGTLNLWGAKRWEVIQIWDDHVNTYVWMKRRN